MQMPNIDVSKMNRDQLKEYVNLNGWFQKGKMTNHVHFEKFNASDVEDVVKNSFFKTGAWVKNFLSVDDIPEWGEVVFVEAIYSQNFDLWDTSRNGYVIKQDGIVTNNLPYVTMDHDAVTRWQIGKVISMWRNENWDTVGTHFYNGKYIAPKDEARRNQLKDGMYEQFSTAHITLEDWYRDNTTWKIVLREELQEMNNEQIREIVSNGTYIVTKRDFFHISPVDLGSNPWATTTDISWNSYNFCISSVMKDTRMLSKEFIMNKIESNEFNSTYMWMMSKVVEDEEILNKLSEKKKEAKNNNDKNETKEIKDTDSNAVLEWDDGLMDQMNELLDEQYDKWSHYVVEIFAENFVYNYRYYNDEDDYIDTYYRQWYTNSDGTISLDGDPIEVERETRRVDLVNAYKAWLSKDIKGDEKSPSDIENAKNNSWTFEDMRNDLQKQMDGMRNDQTSALKTINALQKSLDETKSSLKAKDEEISTVKEKNAQMQKKCDSLISEVDDKINVINSLESKVTQCDETLEEMRNALVKSKKHTSQITEIALIVTNALSKVWSFQSNMKILERKMNKLHAKQWKPYVSLDVYDDSELESIMHRLDEQINHF